MNKYHPKHGHGRKGEWNPNAKITMAQRWEIIIRHENGEKGKDLAVMFGISAAQISRIVNKVEWDYPDPPTPPDTP